MHKRFRTYDLNQVYLLPPSLHDWVPEDHLARFVAAVTAELDLSAIESTYERNDRRGKPAYHPLLLVRLLVYGYAIGMRSSRQIEKATYTDLAFRYLAADQHPDHDTIAAFRQTHLAALGQLFLQTLLLCQKAGLIKLGTIAIDGTKIAANASRQRTRRYERLTEKEQELAATVEKLLAEAQATDQQEDARYGTGRRGDELPAGLATAEGRLARIRAAKQELEREASERAEQAAREKAAQNGKARDEAQRKRWQRARPTPDAEAKANLTDPNSRLMVDGATKAYVQGYNAQVAVDGEAGVIVACAVTQQLNDKQQFLVQFRAHPGSPGSRIGSRILWFHNVEPSEVRVAPGAGRSPRASCRPICQALGSTGFSQARHFPLTAVDVAAPGNSHTSLLDRGEYRITSETERSIPTAASGLFVDSGMYRYPPASSGWAS